MLALKRNNGDGKKLFLNAEGIKYGEKGILSIGRGLNIKGVINENFIKLLVDFQTKRSSALISLPVFSKINGDYYFGLPLYPDMLIGLKSSFPYIGIFRFQFQYLSKFKKIDPEKIPFHFFNNIIGSGFSCKSIFHPENRYTW